MIAKLRPRLQRIGTYLLSDKDQMRRLLDGTARRKLYFFFDNLLTHSNCRYNIRVNVTKVYKLTVNT